MVRSSDFSSALSCVPITSKTPPVIFSLLDKYFWKQALQHRCFPFGATGLIKLKQGGGEHNKVGMQAEVPVITHLDDKSVLHDLRRGLST